jgi:hypothetical protein
MYARSSITAILAALAITLALNPAPRFSLGTTGAITMKVAGDEARYGLIPADVIGHPRITISLGATRGEGALTLSVLGERVPGKGRYPIGESDFRAFFVAGSPEHPLGWFYGESGWVTITASDAGKVSGEFEIRARGFTSANPDDENRWVTVRGTFEAHGDSTIRTVASAPDLR